MAGDRHREDTRVTADHEDIRGWVEERGGEPAVAGREDGLVRVRFADGEDAEDGGDVEAVPWAEFFRRFEAADLAFVYRPDDEGTPYYRFVDRTRVHGGPPPGETARDRTDTG